AGANATTAPTPPASGTADPVTAGTAPHKEAAPHTAEAHGPGHGATTSAAVGGAPAGRRVARGPVTAAGAIRAAPDRKPGRPSGLKSPPSLRTSMPRTWTSRSAATCAAWTRATRSEERSVGKE